MWTGAYGTPKWANGNLPQAYPPTNLKDYADFVFDVVSRYNGKIKRFEIWHKPNMIGFWKGTVKQYSDVLNLSYTAIKSVNWSLPVVSGGITPNATWMDVFLRFKPKFAWLVYHPYAGNRFPAEVPLNPHAGILNLKNVNSKLDSYGFTNVSILVTEFGYTHSNDPAGGNVPSWELVGIYLSESFVLTQNYDYVIGLFWFYYKCDTKVDHGLVDQNWNRRPS